MSSLFTLSFFVIRDFGTDSIKHVLEGIPRSTLFSSFLDLFYLGLAVPFILSALHIPDDFKPLPISSILEGLSVIRGGLCAVSNCIVQSWIFSTFLYKTQWDTSLP
jgi:hypothetical protein